MLIWFVPHRGRVTSPTRCCQVLSGMLQTGQAMSDHLDCKTVVYFAYVRHTSARASARSSNGSRKALRGLILHSLTFRLPFEDRALARALV